MEYPVSILEATKYTEVPKHTLVFNFNTIDYFIWIHIPDEIAKSYQLYQLDEVCDTCQEVNYLNRLEQEPSRPWFKLTTSLLNTSTGHHMYKMSFVNRFTNDVLSLYFAYIIQNDNPDKPYIYMNREE